MTEFFEQTLNALCNFKHWKVNVSSGYLLKFCYILISYQYTTGTFLKNWYRIIGVLGLIIDLRLSACLSKQSCYCSQCRTAIN